ncbi:ABC transporter permease [Petroclostridium sp. X23]|uniref:ABC transporter permease n=1 Tax=Petroclostridium sp. X23 TaxID=3045146 RepID=UPI0024AD1053|nr:ABC transporter permease [Petroclostridium sp. X23]WHH60370.1 ABC transporter permease [Petroclostridium sp. X23]
MMNKNSVQIFMRRNKEAVLAYGVLSVVLVLFAANQNDFFTRYGPQSIFNQVITLCIAALAQTIVVLTSGIDLSIGSRIGLTNAVAATIMYPISQALGNDFFGVLITVIIVMVVGMLAGLFNGLVVVYGRLQPIIVTLATSSIFTGIALYVRPTPGGKVISSYTRLLTGRLWIYVPVSALVLILFVFFVWIPFRRSRLCQAIYAIGSSENSAYFSGIDVKRTKLWVYTLSGLFSACAGLLLTAQTASGDPLGCDLFTINSVAAVVLGGTSLAGGRGGYMGSVAGAIILSLVLGLLIFWGVPSFYQNAVQGLILILALGLGILQKLKKTTATD